MGVFWGFSMPINPNTSTQTATDTTYSMLCVYVLAFAAFVFNTSEFLPIALLSDIGKSYHMSSDQVGIMMTVYAWVVALMSLPMMLLTAKIERKKLLIAVFLVFVVAHLGSFLANTFALLLVSRIFVALAHAVFWSITASLAVRLAPPTHKTKALGILATGSALATVAGLPLGRVLGQIARWQVSFGMIGVLGILILALFVFLLPKLPAQNTGDLKSLPKLGKNKPLLLIYAIIALMVTAHFTAYSYIEPFILHVTDFGANVATMILLVFGVAGFLASVLFARYYERFMYTFELTGFVLLLCALLLLLPLHAMLTPWVVIAFVWGVCMMMLVLPLQMHVLKLAPNDTDVAMSIFSGIFNIGIGGGALVGSLVIGAVGLPYIGMSAAVFLALALVLFAIFWAQNTKTNAPQ